MIKKLIDIASGTYAHWIKNNNKAVADIFDGINNIDISERQQLYKKLLACSSTISEKLLGPDRIQPEKISRAEIKKIQLSDFLILHKNLIRLFAHLHAHIKPESLLDILIGYELLFNEPMDLPLKPESIGTKALEEVVFDALKYVYIHTNILNIKEASRDYILYTAIISTYQGIMPQ